MLLATLVAALATAAAAPAADVQLKIIFPEGYSVRQMADQVSHVRQIAIRKRHVTPVLTGTAYARAAATTARPAGFPRGRNIEGFLFPAGYLFGPPTRAAALIGLKLKPVERGGGKGAPGNEKPYDVLRVAS